MVQNRFHLKPLLPLLADLRFYVLALSQKAVRLFEGTRDSIREIDLHDIPEGLRDAVGYDWEQRSLQFHTGASGRAGARRPAMFHGHGAPKDDEKKEIATYLRQVDRGVSKILGRDTAPLILAAVQYLIPMYHRVSRYPNILDDGVVGNPETLSAGELHRRAWNMVQPKIQAAVAEAATRFDSLVRAGKASGDLEQVLRAAIDGRVDTLLVALGERAFGTYDADSRLETHPEPRRGDQDLLDLAALQALAQGGTVYAVARHEIPGGGLVAAIFRF